MVTLDWRVESRAGISLVELTVENSTAVAQRVRVANRLDGAVWPPRREGVPEAGWDDGGFEGVVASGNRRALGYATPVSPDESPTDSSADSPANPPVELVWSERAGETEREDRDTFSEESTPEGVVRALGDPRPPADAIPRPAGSEIDRLAEESDRCSPVPEPVESWLSGVEKRAGPSDEADQRSLQAEDRAAFRAVARRIQSLREHTPTDTGRSP